ncbi:MAG: hypothetical protein E7270_11465 [Lachnospiraceae bacterium]|nr:hypothetical protein [Lachnospiraceae bacterium]
MIKIVGIILIIASTTLLGIKLSDNLRYRIEELEELKKLMIMLRGEIMYNVASVSEGIRRIKPRSSKVFNKMLDKVIEELSEHNGKVFADIWSQGVAELEKKTHSFKKSDIDRLIQFGNDFGTAHKDIQLKSFDMYIEELENTISDARKKNTENSKMYKSLGILGGFVIVILIV